MHGNSNLLTMASPGFGARRGTKVTGCLHEATASIQSLSDFVKYSLKNYTVVSRGGHVLHSWQRQCLPTGGIVIRQDDKEATSQAVNEVEMRQVGHFPWLGLML